MAKPKPLQQSIEDLQQNLEQLKLDLKSAHEDNDKTRIKDVEKSIKFTRLIIDRLKTRKSASS